MRKNALREAFAKNQKVVNGWIAVANGFQAETYAAQGFDAVTLDMQHGAVDTNDLVPLLQAVNLAGPTAMVRVPWNEPGTIMRALDAGAYGIICPMINTKAEAEAFVAAGRYPPLGKRSNGPFRASQWAGADYQINANAEVLLFAMIETEEAFANLDAILSIKGLDGTYVGPTDLSLSMGRPATLDPSDKTVLATMKAIADKTRAAGKIAGCHTDGPKTAHKRYADGFHFCTLLNDVRLLANAANAWVREAKGQAKGEGSKSY
jgi:4-hydroxy-2-oxoheptanedioate aldolase